MQSYETEVPLLVFQMLREQFHLKVINPNLKLFFYTC